MIAKYIISFAIPFIILFAIYTIGDNFKFRDVKNEPVKNDMSRSKIEAKMKDVLYELYHQRFVTVRPDFLRNPKTGKNLELDAYCERLKLAFEYNGPQHYTFPNFTKQTLDQFHYQLKKDKFKIERCYANGIKLVIIPYTVTEKTIKKYIMDEMGFS